MADKKKFSLILQVFDKTSKGFKSAQKGIQAVGKSVNLLKTSLVAVAGAGGMALLIKRSLEATDSLAKTASKIGTTTEALAGLRYAADLTGVSTQTMDMALQRFTRRTAEAAKGTGEAKGAIRELGIDAQKLNRIPLDERMLVLADAFENVESESDRLRLAFKLFDSEGAALVNTLSQGRDGLAEMLGEAKALGLTMSSDAAKGVEDATDALTKLQSLFKGVTDQVVGAMAPSIALLTDTFKNYILRMIEAKGGVEEFAKGLAVNILEAVGSAIQGMQELTNGVIRSINKLISAKNKITGFFTADDQKNAAQLRDEIARINSLIAEQDKQLAKPMFGESSVYAWRKGQLLEQRTALEELLKVAVDTGNIGTIALTTFGDQAVAGLAPLLEVIKNTNNALETTNQAIGDEAPSALETYKESLKTVLDTMPTLEDNIQSITKNAINGLTDALANGITGAANFADAIKSMAKSVVDSLIKMLIQKYIVDAAFGFITSGFGGAGSNPSTVGMAGSGQNLRGFAAIGGSVQRGEPYMVGERGAEIFVPNQSGAIIPNNKIGGGGTVINQTINISTGVQSTVRAEIATLMPQIANATKQAVADARMRGGSYSKALVGA